VTRAIASTFDLSRYVERVRCLAPTRGGVHRVDRLPDGRTALVLRVIERGRGDVCLVGPRTRAHLKDATGFELAVMVQFKLGWSTPLLGLPAHELTDRYVSLEDVWGAPARGFVFELLEASSSSEAVDRLTRALAQTSRRVWEPTSASLARRAARLLEGEGARVEGVAARLGVTARHLRRVFAVNIGVGPKRFARAARLQRAVRLARSSSDWGRIAADAGYYDQAHLIADFGALVGLTPSAFARRVSASSPSDEIAWPLD
jgi:AraC-like DNA-binding protein